MKNARLKKLASKFDFQSKKDVEILNPELESGIKGGLTCFDCLDKFKCKDTFQVKDANLETNG